MTPIARAQSTLQSARSAQAQAGQSSKGLEQAQAELVAAQAALTQMRTQLDGWAAELKTPGLSPEKSTKLRGQLFEGLKQLNGLKANVDGAAAKVGTAREQLYGAEAKALAAAKEANAAATDILAPLPFLEAQYVDSLEDAGSLSRAKQRALLGADAPIDARTAALIDGNKLSLAAQAGNGPEMLARVLEGTDPAQQAAFLKANAAVVKSIFQRGGETEADARMLLRAVDAAATPEAKAVLVERLAAAQGKGHDGLAYGLKRALGSGLGTQTSFETMGALRTALKQAGKAGAADAVAHITAAKVGELRKDFESKFKESERLKGELAKLNGGFQPLLSEDAQKAANAAFLKKHAATFEATNKAATALGQALPALEALGETDKPTYGLNGDGALKAEALKVLPVLDRLKDVDGGGAAILKGMETQADWFRAALAHGGSVKDAGETMAKVIASSVVLKALKGGAVDKALAVQSLSRLKNVLGIDGVDALRDAFVHLDGSPKSMEKAKEAFKKIDAGGFGASAVQKSTFQLIGLAFSIQSVASGAQGWAGATPLEKVKTVTDAARLSTDAAQLLLKNVAKESVLDGLSKAGTAAGIVGGVLDGLKGAVAISNGKIGEGAADLMSGTGGVLLGLAQIGVRIPGGQLAGAVLAAAGIATKLITGNLAAREAEAAKEADAKDYLIAADVPAKTAAALSDIRRRDNVNIGDVVQQLAPEFKMEPKALFAFLLKHPEVLEGFVDRAFDLATSADGTFDRKGHTFPANGDQAAKTLTGLDDLAAYLRAQGLSPDGKTAFQAGLTD